jgi:hypothetical protein
MVKRSPLLGICKICGVETELIKAHILPKVMFKSVFDEKSKILQVDFVNQNKTALYSDVIYDYNLFCRDCDTKTIGKYESYFADKIMGKRGEFARKEVSVTFLDANEDVLATKLSGLNYDKLKLFFLSILMRSSITTNPFFKFVDVSIFHDEIIEMLKTGVACQDTRFRVSLMYVDGDDTRPFNSVICPRRSKQDGNTHYVFYIAGYAIFINISNHNITPIFQDGYLKADGTMNLTTLRGEQGRGLLEALMGKGIVYNGTFSVNR